MIVPFPTRTGHIAQSALDRLIARHGAWAVTLALLRALLSPRRRPRRVRTLADLGPHLRRDLGLPPEPAAPRYWDLR